jgi:two-component system, cell cycle sensor histidine kinase and response regulator CckA
MPRGGRISVETVEVELSEGYLRTKPGTAVKPGRYAMLAVSDTGHGMDRETLSHIFEPFFTTKGVGQGTGLGLSTVYGIVKQSDGYIWVYSEPGQGTTFKIYLPVSGDLVAPARRDSQPARVVGDVTVLVVEDDAPVRQVMARSLEEAGYRVHQAGSAKEALILAQRGQRVHLVLTDVVMPGMHGRELAERLEACLPGVPVLFTSGYTDAEIERRGLLRPGMPFVQKPLAPGELVRAVRRMLAGQRSQNV